VLKIYTDYNPSTSFTGYPLGRLPITYIIVALVVFYFIAPMVMVLFFIFNIFSSLFFVCLDYIVAIAVAAAVAVTPSIRSLFLFWFFIFIFHFIWAHLQRYDKQVSIYLPNLMFHHFARPSPSRSLLRFCLAPLVGDKLSCFDFSETPSIPAKCPPLNSQFHYQPTEPNRTTVT